MKINYYPDVDQLAISFSNRKSVKTREIAPGVVPRFFQIYKLDLPVLEIIAPEQVVGLDFSGFYGGHRHFFSIEGDHFHPFLVFTAGQRYRVAQQPGVIDITQGGAAVLKTDHQGDETDKDGYEERHAQQYQDEASLVYVLFYVI